MTFLIATLIILLLILSWKYILRLEPAGVFALIWVASVPMILLLQEYIVLNLEGVLFVV